MTDLHGQCAAMLGGSKKKRRCSRRGTCWITGTRYLCRQHYRIARAEEERSFATALERLRAVYGACHGVPTKSLRHGLLAKLLKESESTPAKTGSILDTLEKIHEAGGKAWDDIDDPRALIKGPETP